MKIDMFVFAILFAFAVCGTAQTEDEPTPPPTEEATDDLTEKVIEDLDRVLRNFERLYAEPGTDPGPEEELESIKPTLDPKLPIGDLPYFLKKGEHRLKFGVGYGVSAEIHGSGDVDEAEYVAYYPGWEIGLTDRVGGDAWYAGSVDLNIEGVFLDTKEPEDGFVGGGTLGFRYNFRELGPIVPYSGFGAGLADVDLDLEGLSDGLAFPLYLNTGVYVPITDSVILTAEYRFQHVSNGGLSTRNQSLNEHIGIIGITVLFSD